MHPYQSDSRQHNRTIAVASICGKLHYPVTRGAMTREAIDKSFLCLATNHRSQFARITWRQLTANIRWHLLIEKKKRKKRRKEKKKNSLFLRDSSTCRKKFQGQGNDSNREILCNVNVDYRFKNYKIRGSFVLNGNLGYNILFYCMYLLLCFYHSQDCCKISNSLLLFYFDRYILYLLFFIIRRYLFIYF